MLRIKEEEFMEEDRIATIQEELQVMDDAVNPQEEFHDGHPLVQKEDYGWKPRI
jgi:hypothetical protein